MSVVPLSRWFGPTSSLFGIGMNYRSKQLATGRPTPHQPTIFVKAPASIASGGTVALPARAPDCVDYEGEIAVVIGRPLRHVAPAEARAAIVAVATANDLTARDVMRETQNPMLAKSFPGFGQIGSELLEVGASDDLGELEITTKVNGEVRQHDHACGMLMAPGELVAMISRHVELRPGDAVLTGTPAGTGDEAERYLVPGDIVEVHVAGLVPLRCEITAVEQVAPAGQDLGGD